MSPKPLALPERLNPPESATPSKGPAQVSLVTAPSKGQKKTRPGRQIHAPSTDDPPKLTGLDKNGIGIPSN